MKVLNRRSILNSRLGLAGVDGGVVLRFEQSGDILVVLLRHALEIGDDQLVALYIELRLLSLPKNAHLETAEHRSQDGEQVGKAGDQALASILVDQFGIEDDSRAAVLHEYLDGELLKHALDGPKNR
jgi:hypothetical protein